MNTLIKKSINPCIPVKIRVHKNKKGENHGWQYNNSNYSRSINIPGFSAFDQARQETQRNTGNSKAD